MKKKLTIFTLVLAIVCCGCQRSPRREPSRPQVVVSLPPYKAFVEAISDGKVDVVCLAPEGTNPHVYETPPRTIEAALKAKLWLCLGEPGETKFAQILAKNSPNLNVVDVSQGLSLCEGADFETLDKHVWLSPRLADVQAETICKALCLLLPDDAPFFHQRLHSFQDKLRKLDEELKSYFAGVKNRFVLTTHPSLGYFCRDYGLQQIAIEIDGKEPLPKDIAYVFDAVRSHHITQILIQPQHPTKGALRIAKELHLRTIMINPYGEDYFTNLKSIAYAIER